MDFAELGSAVCKRNLQIAVAGRSYLCDINKVWSRESQAGRTAAMVMKTQDPSHFLLHQPSLLASH